MGLTGWLGLKPEELEIQLVVELEVAEEEPPELRQFDQELEAPPRPPYLPCRGPDRLRPHDYRRRHHYQEPEGLLLRPFAPNLDHRFCKYKVNATIFIFGTYSEENI